MNDMITGDVRPGQEFEFTAKPSNKATSTFTALLEGTLIVTKRAEELFNLPDKTAVLAHRHGEYQTDGFAMTVGQLKKKAAQWFSDHPETARDSGQAARRRSALKGWQTRRVQSF
jgi:hypothetical protein